MPHTSQEGFEEETYEAMGVSAPPLPSRGPPPPLPPVVATTQVVYGDVEGEDEAPPPIPPPTRRAQPPPPPPEEEDPAPLPPRPVSRAPLPPPPPAAPAPAPTPIIQRPPPVAFLPEHLTVAMPLNANGEPPAERPKFIVAKAIFDRVANAYDRTALSFRVR